MLKLAAWKTAALYVLKNLLALLLMFGLAACGEGDGTAGPQFAAKASGVGKEQAD